MHRQVGNATCAPLLFREFEQRRIEGSNAAPTGYRSEKLTVPRHVNTALLCLQLAALWHPIDADAWRAPYFAAGADAARGARAELEERALRGRLRAGWTRWSAEASVRPAAAWIEDVQHALIGPRGVCSHGRRRWERMGDFRPSHMLERVWLHALDRDSTGCNLSRDAATCEWRERVARSRPLHRAYPRAVGRGRVGVSLEPHGPVVSVLSDGGG